MGVYPWTPDILLSYRSLSDPIKPLHREEAKKDFSTKSRFFREFL
ncbi:hypothetical protein MY9_2515 [Bacillus sp. JS]|nr:hypothetical protein MY9_2515 [Bacillus sp. JS]